MCEVMLINKIFFNIKMMSRLFLLVVLMTCFQTVQAEDGTDYVEYAYPLKLTFNSETSEGFIFYELCDWDSVNKRQNCKLEKLLITPQTIAYENFERVPLTRVSRRSGRYASFVYEKSSLIVKTISW